MPYLVIVWAMGWALAYVPKIFELQIVLPLYRDWFGWAFVVFLVASWALAGLAGLVSVVACGLAARHNVWFGATFLGTSVVLGAVLLQLNGVQVSSWVLFQTHRSEFAQVARLPGPVAPGDGDVYGGAALPEDLQHLSATRHRLRLPAEEEGRPPGVLLPQFVGLRGGASGFAWFADHPGEAARFTAGDKSTRVKFALGDGWYWVE